MFVLIYVCVPVSLTWPKSPPQFLPSLRSSELMQMTFLTLCSSSFLALLTPGALSAGLDTSLPHCLRPPLVPVSASLSSSLTHSGWLHLALRASVFSTPGHLQPALLSVLGERSWQQPSGWMYCCSWKPLGAYFYLWGLELRHVFLVTLLWTHLPQLSLSIRGGLVPGHSSSPSRSRWSSLRGCSSCM